VATEVEEVASRMKGLLEAFDPNDLPPGVKLAFLHYRSCLSRNYRYMDRCGAKFDRLQLLQYSLLSEVVALQLFSQQATKAAEAAVGNWGSTTGLCAPRHAVQPGERILL